MVNKVDINPYKMVLKSRARLAVLSECELRMFRLFSKTTRYNIFGILGEMFLYKGWIWDRSFEIIELDEFFKRNVL